MKRLLIANRGEIAVRIARAARDAGIVPLGIFSEADAHAYHLRFMERSAAVGPAPASESYLRIERVLDAARELEADAVHPGYGFLSERAEFAAAVREAKMTFVGPRAETIAAMGSKIAAKQRVAAFDVPVVPGYDGGDQSAQRLRSEAERIGMPVLIKASAGGGGRGMRVVNRLSEFDEALESAKREAQSAFGNADILLERYLQRPRHIEFQILGDEHGTIVHVGERECSIQRRHQKLVEEAPSPALGAELRAEMGAAAVRAARSVDYANAGTVEFMLDADGRYYFLEMNTRLQVEHPVTELVYGIDLVRRQLAIACGERLDLSQHELQPRGAAIEVRIYAEDPARDMLPSMGTISRWQLGEGPGIRIDSGVATGSAVTPYYDPMLAKLIAYGSDRGAAIARLEGSLQTSTVDGVRTNIPLLLWIARDEVFRSGNTTTAFLDERLDESAFKERAAERESIALAAADVLQTRRAWRLGNVGIPVRFRSKEREFALEASMIAANRWELRGDLSGTLELPQMRNESGQMLDGKPLKGRVERVGDDVRVWSGEGFSDFSLARAEAIEHGRSATTGVPGNIGAPMPGRIVKVAVRSGEAVAEHALLVVLEAMKMEHRIEAPLAGSVHQVFVKEGDLVSAGAQLVEIGA